MIEIASSDLVDCAGVGVAGNFAGHLEQAGEAADFAALGAAEQVPKGIFPWYLPGNAGFLGRFPLAAERLVLPAETADAQVQIEPEAGVLFDLLCDGRDVVGLRPRALGAFNDCSVRRAGAPKISEKKNWGAASKGFARRCFELAELDAEGFCHELRLACFLRRYGQCIEYGIDSPLAGYSYFGDQLLDWIVGRLGDQLDAGPLEDVGAQLRACGPPSRVLIGIGATRYTEFGEANYLAAGDQSVTVIYDASVCTRDQMYESIAAGRELELPSASVLSQTVMRAN